MAVSSVDLSALLPQWMHFLAVGLANGRVPPAGLLAIAECIDESYWYPKYLDVSAILDQLDAYKIVDQEVALAESSHWLNREDESEIAIGTWFESTEKLHQLVTRHLRNQLSEETTITMIVDEIFVLERERWQTRFALCALLLLKSEDRGEYGIEFSAFYALINSSSKDDTFRKIPLIHEIACYSKSMSEHRGAVEGHALEVI